MKTIKKDQEVSWDLTNLYSSVKDSQIEKDKKRIKILIQSFIVNYKGKIGSKQTTSSLLTASINDWEEILNISSKLELYAHLLFSVDSNDLKIKLFKQETEEF